MKYSAFLSLVAVAAMAADEAAVPVDEAVAQARAVAVVASGTVDAAAAKAALAKACAFLRARQAEDGSLSNPRTPGLTGLALWALCGAGDAADADAIRKATDFVLSCAQPDGGLYKPSTGRGGALSTYNTAVCLSALAYAKRADAIPVILRARSFLAASQLEGDDSFAGGFGYDKPQGERRYADLSNTHYALQAMRMTQSFEEMRPAGEKKADVDWGAALKFVTGLQAGADAGDHAGGFGYSPADAKAGREKLPAKDGAKPAVAIRSYGSITYAGLEAMSYCKLDRADPRVRSALDWASRHWTVDENPGQGDTGLYYFYEVMGRALSVTGIDRIACANGSGEVAWRGALVTKLLSLQRADGSWANANARYWENDPVVATTFAMLAIESAIGAL